jgi:hypothetical protein
MPANAAQKHGGFSRIDKRVVRRREAGEEDLQKNILRNASYR